MLSASMAAYVETAGFETLSQVVVGRTIDLCISSTGAGLLGLTDPIAAAVVDHVVSRKAAMEASIFGTGRQSTVEMAAMANATLTHVTEYEDVSWPEGQYTCNIIPGLLTVAEAVDASGPETIAALVAGFEVASQPALSATGAIMEHGFLNSSCLGAIGVAAGAARLLGLDAEGIGRAITFAVSSSGGMLRQTGSAAHVLEAGLSARVGVEAALLARRGLGGMPDIFDGQKGYFSAHAGIAEIGFIPPRETDHRIMAVGQKKYPCGYRMQRLLDGIFRLMREAGLSGTDITRCEVHTNAAFVRSVRFVVPANPEEARLSLHHCVAAGLAYGKVDYEAFTPSAIRDPAILAQRDKIVFAEHPEWGEAAIPEFERLVLIAGDGSEYAAECRVAHGDADDPLSRAETIAKFRACTGPRLDRPEQDTLLELLEGLAGAASVASMMAAMREAGAAVPSHAA